MGTMEPKGIQIRIMLRITLQLFVLVLVSALSARPLGGPDLVCKEDIRVYSLLDLSEKLKGVDQQLQRGYMSISLIRYVLKA